MQLLLEQLLNGVQLSLTLFLIAAGLTLIFGIMGVINLAHGSLYMIGAYVAAAAASASGSFVVAVLAGLAGAALAGVVIETTIIRRLYDRDHLDQVLATFGLILFVNEATAMVFGRSPLFMDTPAFLSGSVEIIPGIPYSVYRIAIMVVGLLVGLLLWLGITRTRLGMLIRAGSTHPDIVAALGVDIRLLFTLVFALGALLAGLAGLMVAPILTVQIGMGEQILIYAFVVIVVGGIGSVSGAFAGAFLVGMVDTLGRAFLPQIFKAWFPSTIADGAGAVAASIAIYLVMAAVLVLRPQGLRPVK